MYRPLSEAYVIDQASGSWGIWAQRWVCTVALLLCFATALSLLLVQGPKASVLHTQVPFSREGTSADMAPGSSEAVPSGGKTADSSTPAHSPMHHQLALDLDKMEQKLNITAALRPSKP